MPLLDHFHPPLFPQRRWESFLVTWSGTIADALNKDLPEGYFAEEHANYPHEFEVRVYEAESAGRLVAAVILVSPANKETAPQRWAFANKCAERLSQMVSLLVVDIVTDREVSLHVEIMRLRGWHADTSLPLGTNLYAVAYQPLTARDMFGTATGLAAGVWAEPLAVGQGLPILPLTIAMQRQLPVAGVPAHTVSHQLPIDLEATYSVACQRRRIA